MMTYRARITHIADYLPIKHTVMLSRKSNGAIVTFSVAGRRHCVAVRRRRSYDPLGLTWVSEDHADAASELGVTVEVGSSGFGGALLVFDGAEVGGSLVHLTCWAHPEGVREIIVFYTRARIKSYNAETGVVRATEMELGSLHR